MLDPIARLDRRFYLSRSVGNLVPQTMIEQRLPHLGEIRIEAQLVRNPRRMPKSRCFHQLKILIVLGVRAPRDLIDPLARVAFV